VTDKEKLYNFPCRYPLKVVGRNTGEFYSIVCRIIERHVNEGAEVSYSTRTSGKDKYLSITATFMMQNHEQLTAIYEDLGKEESVLMTL
jgi:uncharacterized protein